MLTLPTAFSLQLTDLPRSHPRVSEKPILIPSVCLLDLIGMLCSVSWCNGDMAIAVLLGHDRPSTRHSPSRRVSRTNFVNLNPKHSQCRGNFGPSYHNECTLVMRLRLGRRLVNVLPLAQQCTNTFTNGVVGRTREPAREITMGFESIIATPTRTKTEAVTTNPSPKLLSNPLTVRVWPAPLNPTCSRGKSESSELRIIMSWKAVFSLGELVTRTTILKPCFFLRRRYLRALLQYVSAPLRVGWRGGGHNQRYGLLLCCS